MKKDGYKSDFELFYEELFKEFLIKIYDLKLLHTGEASRRYKSPIELVKAAIKYFVWAKEHNEVITIQGFQLHSKLWTGKHIWKYMNLEGIWKEDFKDVMLIIKHVCYNETIEKLYEKGTYAPAKFSLQCNYNWIPIEKQIVENNDFKVIINSEKTEDKDKEKKEEEAEDDLKNY